MKTTQTDSSNRTKRLHNLKHMIGNSPLLGIHFKFRNAQRVVYAKAEHLNMTGSIKDRMAYYIVNKAYADAVLLPDDIISEATSGNTGISFASIGRALGHPVHIFMPNWMSNERIQLIKSLGAKVTLVTKEEGGFLGSIQMAEDLARRGQRVFLPRQFSNEGNIVAHEETTGPEIWWQLYFMGLTPDAFVAGVGTGGTVMGVGRFLKRQKPTVRVHPLEPAESPTLSTGHKIGHHRIQGISDEFIPPIVNLNTLDHVINVPDGDAILMAQKLASQLGLAVGISSGANFLGAIKAQNALAHDAVVATVFPDDNRKYLSTDLLKEEPIKNEYLTPEIELLGYNSYKRVCHTCCDLYDCTQHITTFDLRK
jgi:cysteine synthase A